MAVLPIRITGDPLLHEVASAVTDFGPELRQLVEDMIDTMREAPGVGLAAPQVGVGLRVAVIEYPEPNSFVSAAATALARRSESAWL